MIGELFGFKKTAVSIGNRTPRNSVEAFEGCPNRSLGKTEGKNSLQLTCPKYTDGTSIGFTEIPAGGQLETLTKRLGCLGCSFNQVDYGTQQRSDRMERLHPAIVEECSGLFESEHFPEASMRGFMTVRDRLRELTGFEKATEAFGKGGLRIEGAPGEHLDRDFQQGAQFLLMSIDMFRNVAAHGGRIGEATGSETSFEFLTLSSLAMHLLENTSTPEVNL